MRLIDAEALWTKLLQVSTEEELRSKYEVVEGIDKALHCVSMALTIEAKPIVHAHWESVLTPVVGATEDDYEEEAYRCDNCGRIIEEFENYCPSCGAEMYEKRECLSSV